MVEIDFVHGSEWPSFLPKSVIKFAEQSRLDKRFAIIQHTYVEGSVDMYFDWVLWRTLADFVKSTASSSASIRVIENGCADDDGVPIAEYVTAWIHREEKYPPAFIVVRENGEVRMLVVTEYWSQVGGPSPSSPYCDSFTYSFLSNVDLSEDLPRFLETANKGEWNLSRSLIEPEQPKPRSLRDRLLWLLNLFLERPSLLPEYPYRTQPRR